MRRVQHALDLERRLISAQRDLYATISHELRTPVTVIDLSMQNLMRQQPDPAPSVLARYRKIVEATGRLSHLLGQYLKQDRLSSLQPGPAKKWTLTADLLQDASAAARLYGSSHPLRIQQFAGAERIWCDPMLTRLALNNLTENAVKYTPPGTTVQLTVRLAADGERQMAVMEVQDSGPGMPEAELGQVFEPGFAARGLQAAPAVAWGSRWPATSSSSRAERSRSRAAPARARRARYACHNLRHRNPSSTRSMPGSRRPQICGTRA